MPRRLIVHALVLSLIGFAASDPGVEAGKKRVYRISGAARDAKGKPVPTDTLVFDGAGLHLSARYLDGSLRHSALASVAAGAADLFPEPSETGRGYLVIALGFENHGQEDVLFEPGQSRLITDRMDAEFPLDYSILYELASHAGAGAPSLEEIERAVYARAVTVRPGGSILKLLVFKSPRDSRYKKLELRIGALHTPSGDTDVSFQFRKFEVEP
jgi:hypothetical protein